MLFVHHPQLPPSAIIPAGAHDWVIRFKYSIKVLRGLGDQIQYLIKVLRGVGDQIQIFDKSTERIGW